MSEAEVRDTMTDNELRGIVLRRLYQLRSHRPVRTGCQSFDPAPRDCLGRIFEQLHQSGLIDWRPSVARVGAGLAKISAKGVDVVEGTAAAPIAVQIDQSRHVSFTNANNNIVGDSNVRAAAVCVSELFERLDAAPVSQDEKAAAERAIHDAFNHPTVRSVRKCADDTAAECAAASR